MSSLLICSGPVYGHVAPLLATARHLLAQGHDVRFLTGAKYRDLVEATGATFLQLPPGADFDDADLDVAFPGRVPLKGVARLRYDIDALFLSPVPSQVEAIDRALADQPVDAVLAEAAFFGAGVLALRAEHPPVVALGMIPLGLASRDTAPFGLGLAPLSGPVGRLRNRALYALCQHVLFRPNQQRWERYVAELGGVRTRHFLLDWYALADAIVQFTVPEFEYPRSDAPDRLAFVGPVSRTLPSSTPLPDWWGELDGPRPVVHVTQGTIANHDWDELVGPTLRALADDDVLVVVSTGNRPLDSLPPLPANARAATFLPYDRLLPRTDVLVTNGGYGGVHYALEHGVPLVVAGTTEDKVEVTARVAWSGAGINLKTNAPKAESVARAVRAVLADPRYREASEAIGRAITASPGLAGLDGVLDRVMRPARGRVTIR
jgi:UDP:flavonoid glycosyltransferase YjiC (YdhE family)